ncbi:4-amino-4-deoxychorismate lyase [Bacillus salacetis]|uniref:4-amino-4-deoxychorismate lyase n=1 Tax=Bacillus salacetis TaxID=2315464 RepID=A0A3A1QX80_9BACI|nr:aminodeoxychorismate lyase [Bacillus salacetis]RIW29845.1 4-amino-4-deoxychorismate lyase [Bacillus salacetis]
MYVFFNGKILNKEEARISPFDHGFLYGMGLFETMRTYGGHPFLLTDHLERMQSGLKMLNINLDLKTLDISGMISSLSEKNDLQDSYLRLNISAGVGEIGLRTEPYEEPNILLLQKKLPPLEPLREKEAVLLELARNTPETPVRLKSHHYFNNIAAKREVGGDPGKEGLFLTKEGYIAEGITSNIFWVREGKLFTPSLETGILNGITREYIIELSNRSGIPCESGLYRLEDLLHASEAFFTNSVQEIIPIRSFAGKGYPGKNGRITNALYTYYEQHSGMLSTKNELRGADRNDFND